VPLTIEKLQQRVALLRRAAWRTVIPLDGTYYLPTNPSPVSRPGNVRDASWQPLARGELWGTPSPSVWLRQALTIPPELHDATLALHLRWREDANQWAADVIEAQIFLDDTIWCGLDAPHRLAPLPTLDNPVELFVQAHVARPQPFGGLELVVLDPPTEQLAHTFRVGLDVIAQLDPQSLAYSHMLHRLNSAYNLLDLREGVGTQRFYDSVREAQAFLEAHPFAEFDGGKRPKIVVTGHAHIDVAWLWPLWRTRQKAAHTFSTALRLMELYPEYHFTASTPQLYAFVKQDYPELYTQIKQRIAEGRWEAIGGMWLEADCNIPSGESLVRQFVFGMRFFADEFGIRDRVLWLPDVFGYSAALPQILRGCGIDTFMTTKISWNQFNRMPFDTFRWRGIDGSEVLTHFVTTPNPPNNFYTYNGPMQPADVIGAWREYRQKDINDELLYLMGWGDGGGGSTTEQLETVRRLTDMPGMPQVRHGSATDYFARLHERVDAEPRLPTWVGELYLEYHRGTYTSQAWIKQANRRAEQLYHDAEFLDAWAVTNGDYRSQREQLRTGWELILLNQFHDILPGSSIAEVYRDAAIQFEEIMRIGRAVRDAALAHITSDAPLLAVNTLGWERTDPLVVPQEQAKDIDALSQLPTQAVTQLDGQSALLVGGLQVPSYGWADATQTKPTDTEQLYITAGRLENQFFRIEIDAHGEISALYDKRYGRDVVPDGARANQLVAFEDRPLNYDAWDIDIYFEEKPYPLQNLESIEVVEEGPLRGGVEIIRRWLSSTIRQRILVYRDLPRIDFVTEIDWHEHQLLLKTAFPLALNIQRATHEIQFGAVERPTHRNTSWDRARFETCAQRWVDLSEGDYGVALLNDSKYGYDTHGHVVRLTLLKSGISPDPNADQGLHRFTYALLPHGGDWRTGEVVRRAAELNSPLLAYRPAQKVQQPALYCFVSCDTPHVMLDTIKVAEDGDDLIVRLYETQNQRGPVMLKFAQKITSAEECNLLEEHVHNVHCDGSTIKVTIQPFEIKTFRVRLG